MRVLAIQMEDYLFDEFKTLIEESGKTQKAYVIDMVQQELESHKQQQDKKLEESSKPMKWEPEDVVQAIDSFIMKNNRVPSQKEFRSDNGLPSYNAAQRCLEQLPSEYCKNRFEKMQNAAPEQEQSDGLSMNM